MSRFPMRRPGALSRWILAAVLIAGWLPARPQPIDADEIVLVGVPLVRKFPAVDFCPFPIKMEFTSTGGTAKIFVSANLYVLEDSLEYTHQSIDDIVVARDSVYATNLLLNDSSFSSCYSGAHVDSIFTFDTITPADASYYELFDSGTANGWDLANGAYYDNTRSGPINPSSGSTSGTGCLGLGVRNGNPSLADTAKTVITIANLLPGKRYVLTGWWSVDNGINSQQVSMTIQITGPDLVPLARRTWGSLKASYR